MGWLGGPLLWPMLWAQAAVPSTSSTGALALLALKRWCGSVTLSCSESSPSLAGLWAWLGGLGALLFVVVVAQGPGPALGQLFDLPGHVRVFAAATGRLRRSGRMLAVTIGLVVLSWTGLQTITFRNEQGRNDLILLLKSRSLSELALEQGVLAGLTPLRDVASLGSNLPLLVLATFLVFRASADVLAGNLPPPGAPRRPRLSGWANVVWVSGAVLILYRLVSIAGGAIDIPSGNCLMIEAVVVPTVMTFCDGVLLAWMLVELRAAGFDDPSRDSLDLAGSVALLPAATVACIAALPGRYLVTALLLAAWYVPSEVMNTTPLGSWMSWQIRGGLSDLQGAAMLVTGFAGAVAWSRGDLAGAIRGYRRLVSSQGARLVVVLATGGLVSGALAAMAYLTILSLPAASWVLSAADSYAHYGSLPAGILTLSALVELGERSLPEASLASE